MICVEQQTGNGVSDVGAWKVEVLRNRLFRAVDVEVDAISKELVERNARSLLKGSDIVVDTFDNSASRQLVQQHCRQERPECLHVGLYADYCEVVWDEAYRVPSDVAGDVCEYPLHPKGRRRDSKHALLRRRARDFCWVTLVGLAACLARPLV